LDGQPLPEGCLWLVWTSLSNMPVNLVMFHWSSARVAYYAFTRGASVWVADAVIVLPVISSFSPTDLVWILQGVQERELGRHRRKSREASAGC
jgi:hypothetical protein